MAGMTAAAPDSLLPRPLRALAGRALERALNHAVALDPDTRQRLATLDGRHLDVHLDGPGLALSIRVDGEHLRVGPPAAEAPPGLKVRATPGSLLAMALRHGGDDGHIAPGRVEIAGDAELARRLEKLAQRYQPDLEEAFTRSVGDVLGVPMARAFSAALTHLRRSAGHGVEDAADWLRDEAQLAVAPAQMDAFLDQVDLLRERSERLDARLTRLARQLPGQGS